ncbi:hypothetical protein PAPHI01_2445 [Pancytospora philotis]|nr:hypothetical protein PAPHI01_2445 [Pancytospora philotis]
MQETRASPEGKPTHLPGYNVVEVKASDQGHGLLVGLREGVEAHMKTVHESPNILVVKVASRTESICIANVYLHCNGLQRSSTLLGVAKLLKKVADDSMAPKLVLSGDWNTSPDVLAKSLTENGATASMEQTPNRGTRYLVHEDQNERIIDYAISSTHGLIESQERLTDWMISDHMPVRVTLKATCEEEATVSEISFDREALKERTIALSLKKYQYSCISADMSGAEAATSLQSEILQLAGEHKLLTPKDKPKRGMTLSKKTRSLIEAKRKLAAKQGGEQAREQIAAIKAEIAKEIQRLRRVGYQKFIEKGQKHITDGDSRAMWKWSKKHCGMSRGGLATGPIQDLEANKLATELAAKIEVWRKHFASLAQLPDSTCLAVGPAGEKSCEAITDKPVTWDEIWFELQRTGRGKATGKDLIPSEVYKLVEKEEQPDSNLAKALLLVVNRVFAEGVVPNEWRDCLVVPIFKKGDATDPNNYRGIALMSTMLKVVCKVIARRLQKANEAFSLIRREQVGFI